MLSIIAKIFFWGWLACTALFIIYFALIPYIKLQFYKKQKIPVTYFPVLGPVLRNFKNVKNHGDFFYGIKAVIKNNPDFQASAMNMGNRVFLSFVDVKLIKDFYSKQNHYIKSLDRLGLNVYMGEKGLALTEGEEWKQSRKLISQVFHYEYLSSNVPAIAETTHAFLAKLPVGGKNSVDLALEFSKITGEAIGLLFFGEDLNKYRFEGENLLDATFRIDGEANASTSGLIPLLFGPLVRMAILPEHRKLYNKIMRFQRFCRGLIDDRKKKFNIEEVKSKKRKDLLDLLFEKNHELGEEAFSTSSIVDQFITFFTAGMGTTAQTASMALYYLATYPEVKEKVEVEIKRFYSNPKEVTINDLQQMEYFDAFIKEVLRVASPAPGLLMREAIDDHEVGHIKVKKGTWVNIGTAMNCHNPKYFENPEKFTPERFLNWNKGEQKSDPFVFTPFSAGPRNCIGQHLAMAELKLMICEFVRLFNFRLVEGYQLKMTIKVFYSPLVPIEMNLERKESLA